MTRQCARCHGTGRFGPVTKFDGKCLTCKGSGRVAPHAKPVRRAEREAKQRAECDAFNAMLANWNTAEVVAENQRLLAGK
jgi:RecJ-like exonuclease